jgi:TIR domain-containing protein/CHASE2 domain-containing protein
LGDPGVALRREQLRILLASVPIILAAYFLVGEVGSFSERPYVVALVLLPLLAVMVALGLPLVRERRVLLGGGFLPFFVVYCLFFSIAAGTRVLEGRRTVLAGFEGETPSNVLGLSRLGDWHYLLALRPSRPQDLVVVTLPSFDGRPVDEARQAEINLIAAAVNNGAKGIAFDYELAMESPLDRTLCFWIERAESASVPVVLGYIVEDVKGTPVRRPLAREINACVRAQRLGTLTGLKEWDGHVRMVPTSHLGDTTLRSFSYRVAALLALGRTLPQVGLTQFVAPDSQLTTIRGMPDDQTLALLGDRFVLVGSHRPGDIHATPYGSVPGVMIHAYAANSLRSNQVIRRLDVRWILPAVFALCYVLILLQAGGGGVRALLIGAGLICLAIVVAAALAMRVGLLWIDASYPLLAVGTLTAMLSGGARLQRARVQAPRKAAALAAAVAAAEGAGGAATVSAFDVFLSHNSKDKPAVIELASALRDRQLRVWLDVWELVPGRPWQEAIEQVITTVRSGAVLVGKDGLGPWEEPEMRACLDECVRRRMPVIPVLLPGVPAQPKLPLFLRGLTWVDLRGGFDPRALDRLEWGITGIKPRQR